MNTPGNDCSECFCGKVDDLNPADDREAGEESHGASDQAHLSVHFHLRVFLNVVKCRRVKEDLNNP